MVTGAASGIARSLAIELASGTPLSERNTTSIVIVDQRRQPAEEVANEIRDLGAQAIAMECDISSEAKVIGLAKHINEVFGKVNLLFNVAGVNLISKLHETSASDVEWLFSVNVFGMCHMVRHFVPLLKAAAAGSEIAHIVNVSSGFGVAVPKIGPVAPSAYAGTKHAIVGLSDAMRKDLAPDGINVSVVCPGVVNTNAWNSTSFRQKRFGGPRPGTVISKERMSAWGQDPNRTAKLILAGLRRGDFYIFPLDDAGCKSMSAQIEDRYTEIRSTLERSS